MNEPTPDLDSQTPKEEEGKYRNMISQTKPYVPNPNAIAEAGQRFESVEHMPAFTKKPKEPTEKKIATHASSRLTELKARLGSSYIVRLAKERTPQFSGIYIVNPSQEKLEEIDDRARKNFKKLQQARINVPPTYFVAGIDDSGLYDTKLTGETKLFQVTKKVEGQDLKTIFDNDEVEKMKRPQREAFIEELDQMLRGLADYLKKYVVEYLNAKYKKEEFREMFLDDIFKPDQFVFGHIPESPVKSIYLVDTELLLSEFSIHSFKRALYMLDKKSVSQALFVVSQPELYDDMMKELYGYLNEMVLIDTVEGLFEEAKFYSAQEVLDKIVSSGYLDIFDKSPSWTKFVRNALFDGDIYSRYTVIEFVKEIFDRK